MNPNENLPVNNENLSSEENFSPDYEVFSKKAKSATSKYIYVLVGVILFLAISSLLYFFVFKKI